MRKFFYGLLTAALLIVSLSTAYGAGTPGTVKWTVNTSYGPVESTAAIADDGTIYVGTSDQEPRLYAIKPDGTVKWAFWANRSVSASPAIADDGTLYVAGVYGYVYAYDPNGTVKWSYWEGGQMTSSPAIADDGTIYVGGWNNKFNAINVNGTLKWSRDVGAHVTSSPAIAADGTIYVGEHSWIFHAFNPDGTIKWYFMTNSEIYSSPAIGDDGTIYVGSDKFYAINPDGTQKWSYATGAVRSSPAIGLDGTIYVGAYYSPVFYAFNPDGTLKWTFATEAGMYSSPAIGDDGTIYVGAGTKLYAINPDGTLQWSYTTIAEVYASPAIGPDGTVYVGSAGTVHAGNGTYVFYAFNSSSAGLANSAWPMFRANRKHSGTPPPSATLTINKSGTGSGTVTSNPTGINCGGDCSVLFSRGTTVTLTASARTGSTFTGWSGGGCSGTGTCTLTLTTGTTVTAAFATSVYTVSASVSGGHGGVSPATQAVSYGASASIAFTPDAYYHIESITDNANPVASAGRSVAKKGRVAGAVAKRSSSGTTTAFPNPYVINNVTADHNVVVTYAADTYTVNASVSGGHGKVTPATQSVNRGGNATITITPDRGYHIDSIVDTALAGASAKRSASVDGKNAFPSGYVINNVTADHNVVVTFSNIAPLTVEKTGTGTGTVISSPAGINCGATCSHDFTAERRVTLTARPDASSTFTGWSGACSGTRTTCRLPMTEITSVTADFTIKEYAVSTLVLGGHGSVSPATQTVRYGTAASIAITPDAGYEITRIIDNGRSVAVANPYVISNVTGAHVVAVTLDRSFALTVAKDGSGSGAITSTPAGINCGETCTYNFQEGRIVILTARPESDSTFAGWSGACSGTRTTCMVTMSDAVKVTAQFKSEAQIAVSPTGKTHGMVRPGQKRSTTFTVRNGGKKALAVGAVSLSGDASFSITANTCEGKSLSTNQACHVTVTFAPVSWAPAYATLSIASNDPDTPVVQVSLDGNAGLGARPAAGDAEQ